MDNAKFFDGVRPILGGALSQAAVDRINALVDAFGAYGDGDVRKLAYAMATAQRESGGFIYDREIWGPTGAQRGYEGRKDLGNTQPGDGKRFMGRGFGCMITGRTNYGNWSKRLGVDLLGNPDLAAQVVYAARIAIEGALLGTFTGKKLGDYINARICDYLGARRVINGVDHASEIADNAVKYEAALRAAGYDGRAVAPKPVVVTPRPAPLPANDNKPNWLAALFAAILSIFRKAA